ncbi:MAG: archease [Myxococcaceae bacterium]
MSGAQDASPSHIFEEHTGEVQVRIEAATLPELFAEAGRALAELLTDSPRPPSGSAEEVTVQAADRDALLVEWLDELIFRSETRRKVYGGISVVRASDTELVALIRGSEPERLKTAVKAATFHNLRIAEHAGRLSATVVLDV